MKTVVLNDDPTGIQSATCAPVLLDSSADLLTAALETHDSVHVLSSSRAVDERSAIRLARMVRADALEAGRRLGAEVQFVLCGDAALRGHVFAETEVFLDDVAVMLFVPAFPAEGRTTVHGTHFVMVDGVRLPAHATEFANDPAFAYTSRSLPEFVSDKSGRASVSVDIDQMHRDPDAIARALLTTPPGSVVLPDAVTDVDIRMIARGVQTARLAGATVVVRSAFPLAAALAEVHGDALLGSAASGVNGARMSGDTRHR